LRGGGSRVQGVDLERPSTVRSTASPCWLLPPPPSARVSPIYSSRGSSCHASAVLLSVLNPFHARCCPMAGLGGWLSLPTDCTGALASHHRRLCNSLVSWVASAQIICPAWGEVGGWEAVPGPATWAKPNLLCCWVTACVTALAVSRASLKGLGCGARPAGMCQGTPVVLLGECPTMLLAEARHHPAAPRVLTFCSCVGAADTSLFNLRV
jgi:hypothetical protein